MQENPVRDKGSDLCGLFTGPWRIRVNTAKCNESGYHYNNSIHSTLYLTLTVTYTCTIQPRPDVHQSRSFLDADPATGLRLRTKTSRKAELTSELLEVCKNETLSLLSLVSFLLITFKAFFTALIDSAKSLDCSSNSVDCFSRIAAACFKAAAFFSNSDFKLSISGPSRDERAIPCSISAASSCIFAVPSSIADCLDFWVSPHQQTSER